MKKIKHIRFILSLSLLLIPMVLRAQQPGNQGKMINELQDSYDREYGLDNKLYNGIKYTNQYYNYDGNPYLLEKALSGSVTIDSTKFAEQHILYDIYNDQLIIDVQQANLHTSFIVPTEDIDEFRIGNRCFVLQPDDPTKKNILEKVYEGDISCYLDWKKETQLRSQTSGYTYVFTDAVWEGILYMDGNKYEFHSKRSFLKMVPKSIRKNIKSYISDQHIKIKRSDIRRLNEVVAYWDQNK